jgi:GTP-binding protein EngB required for normal cell division
MTEPNNPTMPKAWLTCVQKFARLAESNLVKEGTRRWRDEIRQTIATQQKRLRTAPKFVVPPGIPSKLEEAVNNTWRQLRENHSRLLDRLQKTVEDFEYAAENEDRLVVLVFGNVNAGKSALANHMAGLDFGLPSGVCGECFVENKKVSHLEEKPTECTRTYQGFRLPGLLWIDCPGVGSTSFANGELARRLVARADFILFVTSSDAPLRVSELKEMRKLIRESGNQALECLVIVTKSDKIEEDWETGEIVRRVVPKPLEDRRKQESWVREQIKESGLGEYLQGCALLAVSVYMARDRLGRNWETGKPDERRPLTADWPTAYEASGIPELCRYLGNLVDEHGGRLKNLWPKKRFHAIQRLLQEEADQAGKQLRDLRKEYETERQRLRDAEKPTADDAAQLAAGEVRPCLKRCGIDDFERFDRAAAHRALQTLLRNAVEQASRATVEPLLDRAFKEMDAALDRFAAASQFDLNLQQKTRRQTYSSPHTSAAIGRGIGSIGGMLAGVISGIFFGPAGALLVGTVGSTFGAWVGEAIAPNIWQETRTVEISIGTNADEVICQTTQTIRQRALEVVAEMFSRLDQNIFVPLDQELARLESEVRQWPLKG